MNLFEGHGRTGPNETNQGYQRGKSAVLDHLVPIDERREDVNALSLQGEPKPLSFG